MDSRTKETLVQSLTNKVRRRICDRCRRGLLDAAIVVAVTSEAASVGYTCAHCLFSQSGMVQLSARIKREMLTGRAPGPISVDEIDLVRNILVGWSRPLIELVTIAE
jgi:hypothetical protein